jgi:hypothetical protein
MTVYENPVEDYFKAEENHGKCLSVKTLSLRLDLRKKDVYFYLFSSKHFERVNLMKVGNLGTHSRVFRYVD